MPPTSPSQTAPKFPYFMRTIDSFEDCVEPTDEAINDIFLQIFFTRRSPSLMSCENYLPFRQHKGVWVYQTRKLKSPSNTLPQR